MPRSRRSANGPIRWTRPTTIFEAGDIVRALFPHIERAVLVPRPALVVSRSPVGPDGLLVWALMITNAARPPWPGDVTIANAEALGLLIPSKVRTDKIAAIEATACRRIGRLDDATFDRVRARLTATLPLQA